MADRPILFSAPMVRALLDGRKTQTRRGVSTKGHANPFDGRWTDSYVLDPGNAEWRQRHIRYAVGDRLWVREAWRAMDGLDRLSGAQIAANCADAGYRRVWAPVQYEADGQRENWIADPHTFGTKSGRYRHARFMPRWASRLTLSVTDVRVQRLQDISEEDAVAEGITATTSKFPPFQGCPGQIRERTCYEWPGGWSLRSVRAYAYLWNSLHGPAAWDANPWVVALTFTVHRCNIDQMGKDNG